MYHLHIPQTTVRGDKRRAVQEANRYIRKYHKEHYTNTRRMTRKELMALIQKDNRVKVSIL